MVGVQETDRLSEERAPEISTKMAAHLAQTANWRRLPIVTLSGLRNLSRIAQAL